MFILLVFFGYNKYWAVAIFTVALTLNGAVTAGYLGNGLDIAPNFSGTIFGMANTGSSIGGYVSAWMVGELTHENVRALIVPILIQTIQCFNNYRTLTVNGKSSSESWQLHIWSEAFRS